MAQFIRTPISNNVLPHCRQISQITYRNQRSIESNWDDSNECIIVQDNGQQFYLTSPDTKNITIGQVLDALGYANEQIVVVWSSDIYSYDVLDYNVQQAPMNQISLYAPGQPIPQVHNTGPFPTTEPIADNPVAESVLSSQPNEPYNNNN